MQLRPCRRRKHTETQMDPQQKNYPPLDPEIHKYVYIHFVSAWASDARESFNEQKPTFVCSQAETGEWKARGQKSYTAAVMLFRRRVTPRKRAARRWSERESHTGNRVQHQSLRWEDSRGMKREEDRGRERRGDAELFDEFMWVRSWVAWSQGLTLGKKGWRVNIDWHLSFIDEGSWFCVLSGQRSALQSFKKL